MYRQLSDLRECLRRAAAMRRAVEYALRAGAYWRPLKPRHQPHNLKGI